MSYKNDSNKRGQMFVLQMKRERRKLEGKMRGGGQERERERERGVGRRMVREEDSTEPTSGSLCEGPGAELEVSDVASVTTLFSLGYLVRESSSHTLQYNSTNLHTVAHHTTTQSMEA